MVVHVVQGKQFEAVVGWVRISKLLHAMPALAEQYIPIDVIVEFAVTPAVVKSVANNKKSYRWSCDAVL